MNIILIGCRGAGKSTIGKKLAPRIGRGFVDIDDEVEERLGASITEVVQQGGWGSFREAERQAIREISLRDGLVIAPGGGAVLDPGNVTALKKNGLVIWLKADLAVLCKRMESDPRTSRSRPPLRGKDALEEFGEVVAARNPCYAAAADVEVDTSALNPESTVEKILSVLRERLGV